MDWIWSWPVDEPIGGCTRVVQRNRMRLHPWWFERAFLGTIVPADFVMARRAICAACGRTGRGRLSWFQRVVGRPLAGIAAFGRAARDARLRRCRAPRKERGIEGSGDGGDQVRRDRWRSLRPSGRCSPSAAGMPWWSHPTRSRRSTASTWWCWAVRSMRGTGSSRRETGGSLRGRLGGQAGLAVLERPDWRSPEARGGPGGRRRDHAGHQGPRASGVRRASWSEDRFHFPVRAMACGPCRSPRAVAGTGRRSRAGRRGSRTPRGPAPDKLPVGYPLPAGHDRSAAASPAGSCGAGGGDADAALGPGRGPGGEQVAAGDAEAAVSGDRHPVGQDLVRLRPASTSSMMSA